MYEPSRPSKLQERLNYEKATRASLYIERTLHALQSAGPETLGDGDKEAHKKEFNFTLQTDDGQLRDVKITVHISEAPHKIARPSPLDDAPGRDDYSGQLTFSLAGDFSHQEPN